MKGKDLKYHTLHYDLNPQMMDSEIQVSQLEFEPTAKAFDWKFVCT